MERRSVLAGLGASAGIALAARAEAARPAMPVIDTHIHLFDPNRPQGAPYRGPQSERFYTEGAFPEGYRALTRRYNVVGAIKVEASPWVEDNLWMLEAAASSDIMVGAVGNLQLDAPDFLPMIERHSKNPLLRGIRYGNLWGYDLVQRGGTPAFISGARAMAQAGLALDSANPRVDLLQALIRLNDAVPSLTIIIDHLPRFDPTPQEQPAYLAALREIAGRPAMFVKLSEVIHRVGDRTATDLAPYRERLDLLYATFGEDRVLFGSDWPNILADATLAQVFAVMQDYMSSKTRLQQEKYFWRNSLAAYRWQPRTTAQRRLVAAATTGR